MDNQAQESKTKDAVSRVEITPNVIRDISPISKLPADVLLEIFRINANMDEDRRVYDTGTREWKTCALNFTVIASQVSSFWRDLIINAPILWANVVDLDFFRDAGSQWRELVVWRAQNTPFYVKGSIFLKELDYPLSWWVDFLEFAWQRIRKLDLIVIASDMENYHLDRFNGILTAKYQKGLSFLSRPASVLQSFHLRLDDRCNPVQSGSVLFGNLAPQLRHLETMNLEFATDSIWLSHLHTFHLVSCKVTAFLSVDALCLLLSGMEQLEILSLDNCTINTDNAPDQARILLPRLKWFRFYYPGLDSQSYTKSACWPLLDRIILGRDCAVQVIMPNNCLLEGMDCTTISGLAKNYFPVNQPRALTLLTSGRLFAFCDLDTEDVYHSIVEKTGVLHSNLYIPSPSFFLYLNMDADHLSFVEKKMDQLIKIVSCSSSSFHSVLDLYLAIDSAHHLYFRDLQFGRCLSSFTSLRKLVTNPLTFYHLLQSSFVDVTTVFPRLEVLEVTVNNLVPLRDMLVPFLVRRKESGVPISTFEYRCVCYTMHICILDDFTCLESITDLKVVWSLSRMEAGEYVCGSGTPQVLNFKKKWGRGAGVVDDSQVDDASGYSTDDCN